MLTIILMILGIIYLGLIISEIFYISITMSGEKSQPLRKMSDDYQQPFVSIIVPTFNEKKNIALCLNSLKRLDYNNYEIIVSDGGSQDGTIEIAQSIVDTVIVNKTLPPGWIGKNWGCHLGYLHAKGEYLLFVDADTIHTQKSLKTFMKIALERDSALFTVFPYQIIKKWWESINPVFYFASHLVSGGVNSINNPLRKESFIASGQYMLFKRKDYEKIGGHETIKGSIVDDFSLARVVKVQLGRLYYLDGSKLVKTRMYPDSAKQCWNGWKKCLYPGTKVTTGKRITGALLWYLWALATPVAIVLTSLYTSWPFIVAACLSYLFCCLTVYLYWRKRGDQIWVLYVFLPVTVIIFCVLLGVSALEMIIKKETVWRGRVYTPNLYAGTEHHTKIEYSKLEFYQMSQLETDLELELNDNMQPHLPGQKIAVETNVMSNKSSTDYLTITESTND
ncbi:MAG: glycosyltransferase [Candidatus Thorarchaeota archaeon]